MLEITEYRFRPHRGGLFDALREQASFTSIEALLSYVSFLYNRDISRVRVSSDVYSKSDRRIGWFDIHSVDILNDCGEWRIVGFCSWNLTSSFGGCYAI